MPLAIVWSVAFGLYISGLWLLSQIIAFIAYKSASPAQKSQVFKPGIMFKYTSDF